MEEIKLETLKKDLEEYQKDNKNTVLRHALSATPLSQVVASQDEVKDINFNFDIEIKTLSAANQKASGRCWIFAATNVLREIIAKKLNLKEFELSQSYIAFYDRLEKSNYTMEAIIELIDKDYDDRTLSFIVSNGISEIRENGFGRENIPAMMAAVVVISIPLIILFLIFHKKIMAGVSRGGTKG